MKKFFVLIILFLTSLVQLAFAETAEWQMQIFPATMDIRYGRTQNQDYGQRNSHDFSLGARIQDYSVLAEYSDYSVDSGNATLNTSQMHREFTAWRKTNFEQMEDFRFFWGLGVGAYDESVTTTLSGSATTSRSGLNFIGGVSAGIEIDFLTYLLMNLEGRILFTKDFDPNPQPALIWRLGVQF